MTSPAVVEGDVAAVLVGFAAQLEALQAEVRELRAARLVESSGRMDYGRLVLDPPGRRVLVDGEARSLRSREWDVLAYLAARPGRVISHREVLREVWGSEDVAAANLVEHVRRIRTRLHPLVPISTVRPSGYRWDLCSSLPANAGPDGGLVGAGGDEGTR